MGRRKGTKKTGGIRKGSKHLKTLIRELSARKSVDVFGGGGSTTDIAVRLKQLIDACPELGAAVCIHVQNVTGKMDEARFLEFMNTNRNPSEAEVDAFMNELGGMANLLYGAHRRATLVTVH